MHTRKEVIDKMNGLYDYLKDSVIGQDIPLRTIANRVQEAELRLVPDGMPKGTFIFMGPTGVGKTETAKTLARYLYGSEKKLYRIDMPEYKMRDSITKLIGDHTGRLGTLGDMLASDDGQGGILLFDEMEKADREIVDICLAMLDDARLTVGNGRLFDLSNYYIIFTSNVGSKDIIKAGSGRGRVTSKMMENLIHSAFINAGYRPEFLKRFNYVINFNFITPENARKIAVLNLEKEKVRIGDKINTKLDYSKELVSYSQLVGYNRNYGARPMKNAIQSFHQRAAAEHILEGSDIEEGEILLENDKVKIKQTRKL